MAKHDPKISIVIPVYNGSNFLADAIDSALAQTYKNLEVVVVNDGSTDNGETERIALSYGDKISYYQKKNGGVASALNFGIKKMTGEYFSWLSHDDLYDKTKIEEQVDYWMKYGGKHNIIVACNSYALFNNGLKRKENINKSVFNNYFDIFLAISAKEGLNGCSLLIPKSALIASGGFNVDLPVTQDYDLWIRLAESYKFKLLDRHLVAYRHHSSQDSILKSKAILVDGDNLRSNILHGMPLDHFMQFIKTSMANKRWVWRCYKVYESKGYIRTQLAILSLMNNLSSNLGTRYMVSKKVSSIEDTLYRYGYSTNDGRGAVSQRIVSMETFVNTKHGLYDNLSNESGKLRGHMNSIKNDGLWFFSRRIFRKIQRLVFSMFSLGSNRR